LPQSDQPTSNTGMAGDTSTSGSANSGMNGNAFSVTDVKVLSSTCNMKNGMENNKGKNKSSNPNDTTR
jgi:hypothetical protein